MKQEQVSIESAKIYHWLTKSLSLMNLKRKHCKVQSPKNLEYRNHRCREFLNQEKLFSAHRSNKNPTCKRARKSTQKDVENALLQWFKQAKSRGLIITGPMLREKAKNFGKIMNVNFDPSSSWVTC